MKFSTITLTAIAVFVGSQAIAQTNTISSVSIGTQVTAGGTALGVGTVTPRIGTAGNQAGSVQNNLAGLQYVAGQIPLDGSPASIAFFALTGTAIPAGGDTLTGFISYGTLVFPTQVNVYNDLGSKLKSLSYSALTFASDDLGFGASNFYAIHHAPNSVDYIAAIVPGTGTSTSIADLKPMSWAGGTAGGPASAGSNGYFALAYGSGGAITGYAANSMYYLRTDSSSHTQFGMMIPALTGASSDVFDLTTAVGSFGVGGYTTLAYTVTDIGYGANQFYYLRQDLVTGNTILGRLNPSKAAGSRVISDMVNLGGVFNSLTFVPDATGTGVGWGSSQFFASGALAAGAQSVSFEAIPNHNVGDVFTVTPTASSGLDIALTVVSGPASVTTTGSPGFNPSQLIFTVTTTGPGIVTLQASQAGRLAAPAFNANNLQQSFDVLGLPTITSATSAPGTVGTAFTYDITATGSPTSYTASPLPAGLVLNSSTGAITGTPTAAGVTSVVLTATNPTGTSSPVTVTTTIAVAGIVPVINSATAAPGTVGTAFTYDITATGSPTSYTASPLPAGLVLNSSTGAITGTPTAAGVTAVVLTATNPTGTSSPVTVTTTIAAAGIAPVITSATTAPGTVGTAFTTYTITATGSPTSYTASPLPAGLVLNSSTGAITGTPTAAAVTVVSLTATNAIGTSSPATVTITIAAAGIAPVITSATTAPGTVGTVFTTYTITATGTPTSFTASPLPAGLVLNSSTGAITGTPTAAAATVVSLTATNAIGTSSPATVTITIAAAGIAPVITSATTAPGTVGTVFTTYTITATGTPTSFTASPLPAGLVLNSSTGAITGTPTAAAVTVVSLTATNAIGTSSPATVTITIAAAGIAPVITSATTAPGTVGTVFTTYTITATGSPTSFTASPLPAGLVLNSSTGAITGTPTAAGITSVVLTATNATGTSSPVTVTTTIAAAGLAPAINSATTAPGTVGTAFTYGITATGSPTSFTAGPLPAGLVLNSLTGAITGTPTAAGVTGVVLTATNATGTSSPVTVTTTIAAAGLAPVVNSATSAPGTVGTVFATYLITATGSPTSYAASPLPAGLVLNSLTGAITGTPTAAGVTAVMVSATNSIGTSSAVTVNITIAAVGLAPVITSTTSGYYPGTVGMPFPTYTIAATGSPTSFSVTGIPPGLVLNPLTGAITGTPTAAGTYPLTATATNSFGSGTSVFAIAIYAAVVVPVITSPTSAPGTVGTAINTFPITATGVPTSYTATGLPPGLTIDPVTGAITGTPTAAGTFVATITATNSAGSSSVTMTWVIAPFGYSHIVNFSARALSGLGSDTLIVGFVVQGDGKNLLIRGIGPDLAAFGITNFLPAPILTLFSATDSIIATDSGWQVNSSGQNDGALIAATSASVGAFALPSGSLDSALLVTVNNGVHTTGLLTTNATAGVGLIEIYDTGGNQYASLINVSARMNVTAGDGVLIAGLVIGGNLPKTVLVRGVGPALSEFGVGGVLADPQITVFSGSTQIASNAGWSNGTGISAAAQIVSASSQVGAFPLPSGSKDAALLVTLQPGAYTVQVTSVSNATGVALVEVYDTQR